MSENIAGFTGWLKSKHEERSVIGDLSRDCREDENWPSYGRNMETFMDYLEDVNACDGSKEALKKSWKCFLDWKKSN